MANDIGKQPPLVVAPQAGVPAFVEEDEISLREIFDLLKAGRWTIALVTAAVLALGVLYIVFVPPTYDVNGLVQVEQEQNGAAAAGLNSLLGGLGALFGGGAQTEAEIQIIQSRLVLDQVIDTLNLLVKAEPLYFPLIGRAIARWNHRAKKPVGAPPLLGAFAWGGEKIVVSRFEVPQHWYDKHFTLIATRNGYRLEDPDGDAVLTGQVGQEAQGNTAYGPVHLFVRDLVARPGEEFRLTRYARQTVLKEMAKHLGVAQKGGNGIGSQSGVIQITYSGHDKQQITRILDAIENAYLRQNVERRSLKAQQSLQYLEKQLPVFKEKVDTAQANLANYQQTHGAADVSNETALLLQQNVALETRRQQLIQQREQALQLYTPEHPVVKALDRQIATVEQDEQKLQQKISKLPDTQQEVLSLMRDVDVSTQLYTAMLNAIQQFQVAKASTVGDVRIVDYALEPLKPSAPKKGLVLALSLLLGVFLGTAYVFIQRALLRGMDNPAEIERQFGVNMLVSVPYAPQQRKLTRLFGRAKTGSHLLAVKDPEDSSIEALRSLRTSLHFAMLEAPNNVIMLTGPAPGIGKSFLAANFGALLAKAGKRVVVLDADLRRGHLEKYFDLTESPGISECIADALPPRQIVQATDVENLSFVARGKSPPNPAELLMHERFTQLVQELSAAYDYVLIDSPPVLAVTDAAIVGKLAGTTLVVLKSAEHPPREIEETLKRLASAGVKVRGVLMNQVGARAGSYGYGNYGYTNYRYGQQ